MAPFSVFLVASLGYVYGYDMGGLGGASYDAMWKDLDLADLYRQLDKGRMDGYFDDDLDSRSSPSNDWTLLSYRDQPMSDPNDIFSEASIRDQEYQEHSPLWGYQSVSGGTGDGKEHPKEVKTDKVLPAYCNPPNPCPIGYTEEDNCLTHFENTPQNNVRLMKEQDCPCDTEHMIDNCGAKNKVDTKSDDSANKLMDELNLENNDFLSTSEKRVRVVAKKSPHTIKKRKAELPDMEAINPFFGGYHREVRAKKGYNPIPHY
ncbi:hypothetical protein FSP39_015381 [Pinctada imbricata]|uniref:Neuroendocrine protein 7B2 n=1 Tax=Pinctada imbricata TaxID=66713 RepID=A0AA89BS34_PINIB|nr:hypothetical protein FSP39_015381 [Pinctada imbricata]